MWARKENAGKQSECKWEFSVSANLKKTCYLDGKGCVSHLTARLYLIQFLIFSASISRIKLGLIIYVNSVRILGYARTSSFLEILVYLERSHF